MASRYVGKVTDTSSDSVQPHGLLSAIDSGEMGFIPPMTVRIAGNNFRRQSVEFIPPKTPSPAAKSECARGGVSGTA